MPKYVYKCPQCEGIYEVIHSFSESLQYCVEINNNSKCDKTTIVERIPQQINYSAKKVVNKTTPGQIVDDFIKETKKEVKAYKKEMRDWKPE
jgi:predicted nucleic acid-binding Zn ribbon protein